MFPSRDAVIPGRYNAGPTFAACTLDLTRSREFKRLWRREIVPGILFVSNAMELPLSGCHPVGVARSFLLMIIDLTGIES